jgi:dolichol-phosphate mannosyltransferase
MVKLCQKGNFCVDIYNYFEKELKMTIVNDVTRTITSQNIPIFTRQLDLSIIVPTRNEAGNIEKLLSGIQQALLGKKVEVIFVDDSSDNTPEIINNVSTQFDDIHVCMIHREPHQRIGGLGGAVVAGLQSAGAEYAVVMDGDLQHPPSLLPTLLEKAVTQHVDMVVATRRSQESTVAGLNAARNFISRVLDLTARVFFPKQLQGVSDPLTGFFLVRVNAINPQTLQPKGFKILLEILVRNPNLLKAEVPFHFGERFAGQSKASAKEVFKYLNLLWVLRFGEGTLRFMGFALVGLSGIVVNSLALFVATDLLKIFYIYSAAIATVISTVWNFTLNETLVYRVKSKASSRFGRLVIFFVMNVIALALRTPIMYIFTSVIGIYYIISNLLSLGLLTLARFALADNIIWAGNKSNKPVKNQTVSQGE